MAPLAPDSRRMVAALAVVSLTLFAVRLFAAQRIGFGDSEALYACYALSPAPAYLDHPGLIGLLARVIGRGTAPSPLAAHTVTALASTVAPWLVLLSARAAGASLRSAAAVALGVAVIPEIAVGLFAMTPDLPLFVAWTASLGFAAFGLRAPPTSTRAAVSLVLAGLAAGIGCAAKVSAGALVLALVVTYASAHARGHAKTAWPWLGLATGLVVVSPILFFEARTGWPMLRHRLVDTQTDAGLSLRNAAALLAGQAIYLSPLVVVAAFLVARDLFRTRRESVLTALLANATFIPLALLFPLCLWSRVAEPHWLAPALLALPLHIAHRWSEGAGVVTHRLAVRCVVTAGALSVAAHLWVLIPAVVTLVPPSYDARFDIANELYGWPEVVARVREVATEEIVPAGDVGTLVVVGPHWVDCAQLRAALRDTLPVGCASPLHDDFDDWLPRRIWSRADTVVFVTDNRFGVIPTSVFPDRVQVRDERIPIVRAGRVVRVFSIVVLERRGAA